MVRDACAAFRDAATHAEGAYEACVDAQAAVCERHYISALAETEALFGTRRAANAALLATYGATQAACAATANAFTVFTYKNATARAPRDAYEASHSESAWTATCADAQALTGADLLEAREDLRADASAFAAESTDVVDAVATYAEDRARYDTAYIGAASINVQQALRKVNLPANATLPGVVKALRVVRACLSVADATPCPVKPDARAAFGDYAELVATQVSLAADTVAVFTAEAQAYQQRAESAFEKAAKFHNSFTTWAVDGLCRLAWRSLTDAVFVFEGACYLDGTPVAGDTAARAHLREDLRRRLAFWRRVGMLKVAASASTRCGSSLWCGCGGTWRTIPSDA